jgi:hypothetical protein
LVPVGTTGEDGAVLKSWNEEGIRLVEAEEADCSDTALTNELVLSWVTIGGGTGTPTPAPPPVLLVDDDVDSPIDGPKLASLPFLEGDSPETDGRFFSLDDPRPPVENFFWSHEDFFSLPVGGLGARGGMSK